MEQVQPVKKPRIYCPCCYIHMFSIYDLIIHVQTPESGCAMTVQRLYDVGVLDDGDMAEFNRPVVTKPR